jgi:hypothetical protein
MFFPKYIDTFSIARNNILNVGTTYFSKLLNYANNYISYCTSRFRVRIVEAKCLLICLSLFIFNNFPCNKIKMCMVKYTWNWHILSNMAKFTTNMWEIPIINLPGQWLGRCLKQKVTGKLHVAHMKNRKACEVWERQ